MKNKFNETGTDFGKELSATKINSNRFSIDSCMPKEGVNSISRATSKISKDCIRELLEKIITQYNKLHSDLDQIVAAYTKQGKTSIIKPLKGGAPHKMAKTIITIRGVPVIDIYESFDGSYWFITEKLYKQDTVLDGKIYRNDQILFGYARLSACPEYAEFGNISETELRQAGAWKVPKRNWAVCPEVEEVEAVEPPVAGEGITTSPPLSSCLNQCKEVI